MFADARDGVRHIDFGNDGIREPLVERVPHDADDLERIVTERERRPLQSLGTRTT